MQINWFGKSPKGRIDAASEYKITFTDSPKGIRINVTLTKELATKPPYLKIGLSDDNKLVLESTTDEQCFKIKTNKSSTQVSAATIGEWAISKGFIKKSVVGTWDKETQCYVFDLSTIKPDVPEISDESTQPEAV